LVQHLLDFVTHFISAMGYPGIAFLMTLSSACIPIPSEAIMPFSGSLIVTDPARGFRFFAVVLTGAFGDVIGSSLAYWVGATGGRPLVEKYGRYLLIRKHDLDTADRFYAKYGDIFALVSRMTPIIRSFTALPAGIARMKYPRFAIYTFLGALPFCYLLTWLGVKLGEHWEQVHVMLKKADLAVAAALIVLFGLWLWRHLRPEPVENDDVAPLSSAR
jgi:membrane protein DedA with SNARE-associated domain